MRHHLLRLQLHFILGGRIPHLIGRGRRHRHEKEGFHNQHCSHHFDGEGIFESLEDCSGFTLLLQC